MVAEAVDVTVILLPGSIRRPQRASEVGRGNLAAVYRRRSLSSRSTRMV
jgi:hypothetical protein